MRPAARQEHSRCGTRTTREAVKEGGGGSGRSRTGTGVGCLVAHAWVGGVGGGTGGGGWRLTGTSASGSPAGFMGTHPPDRLLWGFHYALDSNQPSFLKSLLKYNAKVKCGQV